MDINQHNSETGPKWKSTLKRMLGWGRDASASRDKEKEQSGHNEETKQEKEIRKEREDFKKFFDEFKEQTSLNVDADKLTNAINNFQYYEDRIFDARGYDDGIKGTKDRNIQSSAKARADFIYEHASSILAGRIKGLESELALKSTRVGSLENELVYEQKFNDGINFLNKKEHRHFSRLTAWFYIVAGFAMMFADFPISLGISKYFIDLPISFKETFMNKISNPEILLFSLGITFLSIYYKILYDEYINVSIIPERLRKDAGEEVKSILKSATGIIRALIKLTILFFLLYLLYNIGNVRNALNELTIRSSHPDYVTEKEVFHFKLISFIGTTILLPLLSGICLSVGFGTLSNFNNLKSSNNTLKELLNRKQVIETERTNTETVQHMLKSLMEEWSDKEAKIAGLQQLFSNSYYQGFRRGHRMKFGYDIYENAHSLYIDNIHSSN